MGPNQSSEFSKTVLSAAERPGQQHDYIKNLFVLAGIPTVFNLLLVIVYIHDHFNRAFLFTKSLNQNSDYLLS